MNTLTITSTIKAECIKCGVIYGIIAALSFAIMSVFVKLIGRDLPTSITIFFRFATSLILLIPWLIADPNFSFKIQQPARYVTRILASLLALFCVFYGIKFIPLVDVLLLNNTAPLFVPLIVWLLAGAKTSKKAIVGIIFGFIGISFILNPGKEIFSLPSLIALSSGLLAAIGIVQIRLMSKNSTIKQILFYYFLVSTLAIGLLAITQWQTPANAKIWLFLLGIGIFGTLSQVFSTLSYAAAPVRLMSPLLFLMVIFGGIFDWLLWNHVPSLLTIIGTSCVIFGVFITVYFGNHEIQKLGIIENETRR